MQGSSLKSQQCAMLGVCRRIQQSADFFPAPDRGQFAAHLGLYDLLIEPGLLQRARVEELQRKLHNWPGTTTVDREWASGIAVRSILEWVRRSSA